MTESDPDWWRISDETIALWAEADARHSAPDFSAQRVQNYVSFLQLNDAAWHEIEPVVLPEGEPRKVALFHGLGRYAADTARAALRLMDDNLLPQAAVLVRVVMEYAATAHWIDVTEGGVEAFDLNSDAGRSSWRKTVAKAGLGDLLGQPCDNSNTKFVSGLKQVEDTLAALDAEGHMYLQYRHFSKYVHPDRVTVASYVRRGEHELILVPEAEPALNPESMLFFLARSAGLATIPFLFATEDWERGTVLGNAAKTFGIPLRVRRDPPDDCGV